MPYNHMYAIRHSAAVSTAITILQIASGATGPLEIIQASLTQRGSVTSLEEEISWVRKSAAATVTAGVVGTHVFKLSPGDPTPSLLLSTTGTGVIATSEGTDTDILWREGFNVLNGWIWQPVPQARIILPAAAFIGLKFFTAPTSQNWDIEVIVRELG